MKLSSCTKKILTASAGVSVAMTAALAIPAPGAIERARVAPKPVPKASAIFRQADTNKDGVLSEQEFAAVYAELVKKAAPKVVVEKVPVAPRHPFDGDSCPGCGLG